MQTKKLSGLYVRGLRSPKTVGMSSETVGWMCTARCNGGVGGAGVHGVDDAVDGLVAAGAEDGGAEDLLAFGVDENFHEAFGLALFDGAGDLGHGAGADERRFAGFADLALR